MLPMQIVTGMQRNQQQQAKTSKVRCATRQHTLESWACLKQIYYLQVVLKQF